MDITGFLIFSIIFVVSNCKTKNKREKELTSIHESEGGEDFYVDVHWAYDEEDVLGADKWGKKYAACDANKQSPIDIHYGMTTYRMFEPFEFMNYNAGQDIKYWMVNNGHSVMMELHENNIQLKMNGMRGTFDLLQMHLHWGKCDHTGSEHYHNGMQFAGEIHWVHQLNKNEPMMDDGFNGQLLVLGTFIHVNDDAADNPTFQKLLDASNTVRFTDHADDHIVGNINLFDLMSKNEKDFYHYHGSLTTPPCNETVYWFVFNEPIVVSSKQMGEFRKTLFPDTQADTETKWKNGEFTPTEDNYRPLQQLAGRPLYRSFYIFNYNSGTRTSSSMIACLFGVLIYVVNIFY